MLCSLRKSLRKQIIFQETRKGSIESPKMKHGSYCFTSGQYQKFKGRLIKARLDSFYFQIPQVLFNIYVVSDFRNFYFSTKIELNFWTFSK